MAGKNRANAPSAIVLGCETGVGIASWIGDVFGTSPIHDAHADPRPDSHSPRSDHTPVRHRQK